MAKSMLTDSDSIAFAHAAWLSAVEALQTAKQHLAVAYKSPIDVAEQRRAGDLHDSLCEMLRTAGRMVW